MENSIDKELLISYFSGNATANQKQQVELWLDSNLDHWDFFYQCLEEWERSRQETDFEINADFENLTKRIFLSELFSSKSPEQKNKKEKPGSINLIAGQQLVPSPIYLGQRFRLNMNKWQKMAAAVAVLSAISILSFFFSYNRFTVHAACGRIEKVVLPDSSTVILNTDSEIRYLTDWDNGNGAPREVWLKGEAFFSVTHTEDRRKFIVHTSDHFSVEALGTEFNVFQRTSCTRVVLNSGKVRLQIRNTSNNSGTKNVMMAPGDLVESGNSSRQLIRRTVNPEMYSSWKDNRLLFDNTSLPELRGLLKERYGLKVIVADTSLSDIRFNGDFPSGNVKILLKALATTYNLQITARSTEVYLEPNNNK